MAGCAGKRAARPSGQPVGPAAVRLIPWRPTAGVGDDANGNDRSPARPWAPQPRCRARTIAREKRPSAFVVSGAMVAAHARWLHPEVPIRTFANHDPITGSSDKAHR